MAQPQETLVLKDLTAIDMPLVQEPIDELQDPYNLSRFIKPKSELKKMKSQVKEFYQNQNELIELFLTKSSDEERKEETEQVPYKIAVYGSFAANVTLFALQLTASILSGSLALLATTADAFMDVASSTVLIVAGIMASRPNYIQYPTGKNKYKTAGIIVFSTLMATLSIQLLVESGKSLIDGYRELRVDGYTYAMVGIAFSTNY
jgi:hypothetical protein